MKNCFYIFHLLLTTWLLNSGPAMAQQTFHKSYGNPSATLVPLGIIGTSDGGYLIFGDYYNTSIGKAGMVIKTDAAGDTLWTTCLDNTISTLQTTVTSVIEIPNGQGYMLAGYYSNPSAPMDPSGSLLFRLDASGNQVSVKVFNYGTGMFWFTSCTMTWSGFLLITAINGSMFTPYTNILMKATVFGTILWTNEISGFEQQDATTQVVKELPDHSIVLLCDTIAPPASINAAIIKFDSTGAVLWAKNYGWANEICIPVSMTIGTNNSMLVTGQRIDANNMSTGFILSLDSSGNMLWCREYGNLSPDQVSVRKAYELGNGDIAALTRAGDTVILFGTDQSGNVQWTKGFHPVFPSGDYFANDFVVTSGGGFAIAASDIDNGHLIKTDPVGNNDCDTVPVALNSVASPIVTTNTMSQVGSITVQILTPVFNDHKGVVVADACATSGIPDQQETATVNVFPNPAADVVNITVSDNEIQELLIYDLTSKKLLREEFYSHATVNTAALAKGIYVYEIRSKNGTAIKGKLVKD